MKRSLQLKKVFSLSEEAARNSLFLTTLRTIPFVFNGLEEMIKQQVIIP
jgi:hypothetical protein